MKWNIDDIPSFIAAVEQGGISAAASKLNISKSTVSKALSRLEEALGVRLLDRNSRNVRVTSEGQAFYQHCIRIMEQVNEANGQMAGLISEPQGKLVAALPIAFSREFVAQHIEQFRQRYPDIELEIIITSSPVDIIRDQIDLAVGQFHLQVDAGIAVQKDRKQGGDIELCEGAGGGEAQGTPDFSIAMTERCPGGILLGQDFPGKGQKLHAFKR